jgi:dTDP-4-amino-4,6-dideoxygalactose transaminase
VIEIPFFVPDFGQAEEDAVVSVLRSGWIAMGPRVEAFEKAFAEVVGTRDAVALNSCTAALHLANILVDLGPGDEAIVPSLTFAATANAVAFTGARPVFADITSEDDWTLSPEDVSRRITPKTKAIVAMHYAGYPCDMKALSDVAESHGVALIEDACHGLGGTVDGQKMGSVGLMGCFSFYSNKIMTTGEGGMLTTDDLDLARRARALRSHGQTKTAVDRMRGAMGYDITEVGYNYRLDDLRASIGLVQLARLSQSVTNRRGLIDHYRARLDRIEGVRFPRHGGRGEAAHYILPIMVDGVDRDGLRNAMAAQGIQTSMHYPPVHHFAHYRTESWDLPHTERVGESGLSLPLYPSLTQDQVDRVCDVLETSMEQCR